VPDFCAHHEDHETRIKKLENSINEMIVKITDIDKETTVAITKVAAVVEQLSKLPEAIDLMRQSLEKNNHRTEDLTHKVDKISCKIDTMEKRVADIDNKDRISILDFVKKNWVPIFLAAGMLMLWLAQKGII